jgi:hypothetical protein
MPEITFNKKMPHRGKDINVQQLVRIRNCHMLSNNYTTFLLLDEFGLRVFSS